MIKEWRHFIKSDPTVMMGKPVITGTRVTVELILEKLAAGETVEQIIDEHPHLTKESVYTALRFIKKMPKDKNIKRVLVIGSGRIIIGQACEFDYSGTQACKALKEEGYEVMLVNSNPATIMTNPGNTEELAVKGTFYVYKTDGGKWNSSEKERGMDAVIERNFGNFLWSSYK